ncbi:MAG: hypothetical protein ACYCO9_15365 [Streptosporangiaceae bacterium]
MQLPEYAGQDSVAPVKAIRSFFAGIGQPRTARVPVRSAGRHGTVPGPRAADGPWPAPGSPEPGSPAPSSPAPGSPAPARTVAGSGQARRAGRAGRSRSARRRDATRDRDPRWPSLNLTNNVRLLSEDDLAHLPAADPPGIAARTTSGQVARQGGSRPAQIAPPPRSFEPVRGARPPDPTNNVRLLSPGDLAMRAADPPAVPAARHAAPGAHSTAPGLADPAGGPASLPLAGYDQLTLPALRARLRWLDQGQIRVLLDYERANAARPEVITMFERRIGKLRAGRA